MRRARLTIALVLAVLVAGIAAAPALAACPQTSLPDIESEVMCPVCGTPLNTADAPQAERERVFIRGLIARCASEEEIKAELVDEFGPAVLALPKREGFNLAAYLVPIGLGLLGALAIALLLVRWRRRAAAAGTASAPAETPADPGPAAGSEDEQRRLDADLRRYDV